MVGQLKQKVFPRLSHFVIRQKGNMWKVILCRKDLIFDCLLLVYVTVTPLLLVCSKQKRVKHKRNDLHFSSWLWNKPLEIGSMTGKSIPWCFHISVKMQHRDTYINFPNLSVSNNDDKHITLKCQMNVSWLV